MSIVVEIEDPTKLDRAREILGTRSNVETLELALDRVIDEDKPNATKSEVQEVPESYWEELFAQPMISSELIIKAVEAERNEERY